MVTDGTIFNLQKYSIHDGPGIRTTVFLKGCPLKCQWCHNPESWASSPKLMIYPERCIGCGQCINTCPQESITYEDGAMYNDSSKCTSCGACAQTCPSLAREMAGRITDVPHLIREIEKDTIFYEDSGGGVTFSGGEPLMQPDFLSELLHACKLNEIHTAVDTSGYASRDTILRISAYTDLFLFDLKMIDDEKHRYYTGISNQVILENLTLLTKQNKRLFIRMPIIPTVNDDLKNIEAAGKFLLTLNGIEQINLLPYHNIAQDKYRRLNQSYRLGDLKPPSDEKMAEISEKLQSYGFKIKIGG